MNTQDPLHYKNRYNKQTKFRDIEMTMIGGWSDIAVYYEGSDGQAYSFQGAWTNMGTAEDFKARLKAGRIRGELLENN